METPTYWAQDDEPIFVLRAQDRCFVALVRLWIELVEMDAPQPVPEDLCARLMEAVEIANRGLDWQNANPQRVAEAAGRYERCWVPTMLPLQSNGG